MTLQKLRKSKGYSLADVASGLKVREITVQRWEDNGIDKISLARKVAKFYGISFEKFLDILQKSWNYFVKSLGISGRDEKERIH